MLIVSLFDELIFKCFHVSMFKLPRVDPSNIMKGTCVPGGTGVSFVPVNRATINKINKIIKKYVDKIYYKSVPVTLIEEALKEAGFALVNEDGTEFSAIFCGANSSSRLSYALASSYDASMHGGYGGYKYIVSNSSIIVSWYSMPSGNYEINVYAS